jgi:general secretion pathway protein H
MYSVLVPMARAVVKAWMQTSAPGNKAHAPLTRRHSLWHRGFTLLELMVVVAIIAITAAVASLALPNPASSRLEREAARLIALLESARAEARAGGMTVLWVPQANGGEQDYQFLGLPAAAMPSLVWMERSIKAEVLGGRSVVLGPEPVIGAQRVVLVLDDQQLVIATDGLSPFAKEETSLPADEAEDADNTPPAAGDDV